MAAAVEQRAPTSLISAAVEWRLRATHRPDALRSAIEAAVRRSVAATTKPPPPPALAPEVVVVADPPPTVVAPDAPPLAYPEFAAELERRGGTESLRVPMYNNWRELLDDHESKLDELFGEFERVERADGIDAAAGEQLLPIPRAEIANYVRTGRAYARERRAQAGKWQGWTWQQRREAMRRMQELGTEAAAAQAALYRAAGIDKSTAPAANDERARVLDERLRFYKTSVAQTAATVNRMLVGNARAEADRVLGAYEKIDEAEAEERDSARAYAQFRPKTLSELRALVANSSPKVRPLSAAERSEVLGVDDNTIFTSMLDTPMPTVHELARSTAVLGDGANDLFGFVALAAIDADPIARRFTQDLIRYVAAQRGLSAELTKFTAEMLAKRPGAGSAAPVGANATRSSDGDDNGGGGGGGGGGSAGRADAGLSEGLVELLRAIAVCLAVALTLFVAAPTLGQWQSGALQDTNDYFRRLVLDPVDLQNKQQQAYIVGNVTAYAAANREAGTTAIANMDRLLSNLDELAALSAPGSDSAEFEAFVASVKTAAISRNMVALVDSVVERTIVELVGVRDEVERSRIIDDTQLYRLLGRGTDNSERRARVRASIDDLSRTLERAGATTTQERRIVIESLERDSLSLFRPDVEISIAEFIADAQRDESVFDEVAVNTFILRRRTTALVQRGPTSVDAELRLRQNIAFIGQAVADASILVKATRALLTGIASGDIANVDWMSSEDNIREVLLPIFELHTTPDLDFDRIKQSLGPAARPRDVLRVISAGYERITRRTVDNLFVATRQSIEAAGRSTGGGGGGAGAGGSGGATAGSAGSGGSQAESQLQILNGTVPVDSSANFAANLSNDLRFADISRGVAGYASTLVDIKVPLSYTSAQRVAEASGQLAQVSYDLVSLDAALALKQQVALFYVRLALRAARYYAHHNVLRHAPGSSAGIRAARQEFIFSSVYFALSQTLLRPLRLATAYTYYLGLANRAEIDNVFTEPAFVGMAPWSVVTSRSLNNTAWNMAGSWLMFALFLEVVGFGSVPFLLASAASELFGSFGAALAATYAAETVSAIGGGTTTLVEALNFLTSPWGEGGAGAASANFVADLTIDEMRATLRTLVVDASGWMMCVFVLGGRLVAQPASSGAGSVPGIVAGLRVEMATLFGQWHDRALHQIIADVAVGTTGVAIVALGTLGVINTIARTMLRATRRAAINTGAQAPFAAAARDAWRSSTRTAENITNVFGDAASDAAFNRRRQEQQGSPPPATRGRDDSQRRPVVFAQPRRFR